MSLANVIPREERENYKNAFDAFDEDRDDMIESNVLGKLLRALGYNPYPEEVEDMIEDVGKDHIDFDSFMYLVSRHAREADPERELIDSFRVLDKQGKGVLPKNLIVKVLKNVKQPFTDEQINELLKRAKPKKDDLIDYKEFVQVLLSY